MIGLHEFGEVAQLEVELLHLHEQVRRAPIGAGRHPERLLLDVAEQDVHELAADEVAGQRGQPFEAVVGVVIRVQELRRA